MTRQKVTLILLLLGAALVWFFLQKEENQILSKAPPTTTVPSAVKNPGTSPSQVIDEPSGGASPTVSVPMKSRTLPSRPGGSREVSQIDSENIKLEKIPLLAESRWHLWPGVRAVAKSKGRPIGKILGEVSGFYLVEDSAESDLRTFSAANPWVVFDPRLNKAGVVTGQFSVVLKEGFSADILNQMPGLKVVSAFPSIRTFYVTSVEESFDLQTLRNFLKNEPGVEDAQPEILSRQYEKY